MVSTHSRPKAAARTRNYLQTLIVSFNTQPPEGGCKVKRVGCSDKIRFNTQPPEGGCSLL